jgi:hypothetical protein
MSDRDADPDPRMMTARRLGGVSDIAVGCGRSERGEQLDVVRFGELTSGRSGVQVLARLCVRGSAEMMGSMRLPWIAASGTVVVLTCGVVLDALSGHGTGAGSIAGWVVATVASSGFGLVLATRRRRSRA